jgi:sulfite reductase alpha subunit-like flavoprotein
MTVYCGGRPAAAEFYYESELSNPEARPWFTQRNAWSRDQEKKVYIQHLVKEDAEKVWNTLGAPESRGMYFLCGPTWPAKDIQAAIEQCFVEVGGMAPAAAADRVNELIALKRWVVEVY